MILIIGAGPIGCYTASLLAENFEVAVFEEHKQAGLPVQCTGIVTNEIFNYVPKKNDFVINKCSDVKIFSPNNKFIQLKLRQPDIIINRQRFDEYFYKQAKKKGAKYYFKHKFIDIKGNTALIKDLKTNKTKKIKFTHLIGADGPLSQAAKAVGITNKKKYFVGVQAIIKKKNNNTIDFYPIKQGFCWSVPENNNTLRVGAAAARNTKELFKKIIKKYKGKRIETQGGLIPIFNPYATIKKNNVFLIGDSAGFVKATTGGGLIPGLKAAEILAHSIKNNLSYEAGIYLHLYPKLWLNLKMRKIMDSFNEKDWNNLIKEFKDKESKKILQNINRDKLFQLLISVAMKKPGMMKYVKHLF